MSEHPTKEIGGLTHEGFLGMWRAYLGLKAERDGLREALTRLVNDVDESLREGTLVAGREYMKARLDLCRAALERHP